MEHAVSPRGASPRGVSPYLSPLLWIMMLLLSACGGSSGGGSGNDGGDPGTPPVTDNDPPASGTLSVTLSGERAVAEQSRQTLRALVQSAGTYQWQWQTAGVPAQVLAIEVDGERFSYTAPDVATPTDLSVEATATSADGTDTGSRQITVRVYPRTAADQQPRVSAGDNVLAGEGETYTLIADAAARHGRSIRRLAWSQVSGPPATVEGATDQDRLEVTLPQVEQSQSLQFRVSVTDSGGFSADDHVMVTVEDSLANRLPNVDAGQNQTVLSRQLVSLQGQASDADGEVVELQWQLESPYQELVINDGNRLNATFTAPNVADTTVLTARLSATDDSGGRASDSVAITVSPEPNRPPRITLISAEPDSVQPGDEVRLEANAEDADGDELRYQWRQVGGPAVAIRDADTASASLTAPDVDEVVSIDIDLEVNDGADSDLASVSIQVSPADDAPGGGSGGAFPSHCLSNPLHSDCPLYALSRLLVPDLPFCTVSPFSEGCLLGDLLGPALSGCLLNPALESCGDALGDILDPSFLLEQLGQSNRADSCTPDARGPFQHYRGALHEHTAYSDGTYLTRPANVYQRVASKGLDFAGTSDHSDNLGFPLTVGRGDCALEDVLFCLLLVDKERPQDALIKWWATQEQADAASHSGFTAFRGFEWTSDRFGHANVFFSDHYINAKTGPGYAVTMALFWQWFILPPEIGGGADGLLSFNHPGREDAIEEVLAPLGGDPGFTFNDFRYVESADYRVVGIEVFGKGSEYDSDGPDGSWLSYALDKGWHLAPVGSEDHHGISWGDGDLPKTVLIAKSVAEDDLRDAMLARRMYAVAQDYNDVYLDYTVDGKPMGSRLGRSSGLRMPVEVSVSRLAASFSNPTIELVGPGNTVMTSVSGTALSTELVVPKGKTYAFVRVLDGGRPVAFSAPIWLLAGPALPTCSPPQSW